MSRARLGGFVGGAVYGLGVLAWSAGVWMLPSGNVLWPAAVLAGLGMPVGVRLAGGRMDGAGGRFRGVAGGVWWGLAVFAWGVPHVGLPYRPDVLYGLMLLAAWLGLGVQAVGVGGGRGGSGVRAWGVAGGVGVLVSVVGWLGLYWQGVAPWTG